MTPKKQTSPISITLSRFESLALLDDQTIFHTGNNDSQLFDFVSLVNGLPDNAAFTLIYLRPMFLIRVIATQKHQTGIGFLEPNQQKVWERLSSL